jgi:hypothetical protein
MNATQMDQFEQFWRAYPRRIGKGAARKAFEKALKLATVEEIMTGLSRQLSYYASREQQFIPHPTTWLNQERWADEPQAVQRYQTQQPRRTGDMADFLNDMEGYRDGRRIQTINH